MRVLRGGDPRGIPGVPGLRQGKLLRELRMAER